MSLRIYNTLSRATEPFVPLEAGHVRMYVCGMTVYDLCHLGHARSMVAFDIVQRWLRASGLAVTYVRNITDIDDKIIRRALENGEPIRSLTDRMVDALHQDADALGIARPTHEPRATDYVPQMLAMIAALEQHGFAYRAGGDVNYAVRRFAPYGRLSGKSLDELRAGERIAVADDKEDPLDFAHRAGGDVNYAVRRFAPYGRLSGKSLDELRAGERIAVADDKEDPLDFALWKRATPSEPQDAQWPSPYGAGR